MEYDLQNEDWRKISGIFCSQLCQIRADRGIFDHLVPTGEFLEILTFSDRTKKKDIKFLYFKVAVILQVCKKTAHLLIKNSPKSANGKYYIRPCL